MAIMTGKIQMRQGQEVNFDPDKMSPGEWAVSLDTKYIRMCFSPGVCIRMATYEAFETDMAQIKAILAEAKTVQSAVIRINNEVSDKLDAVVEYTGQAKTYRDQALQYRNDAERFRNETQQVAGGNFLTPESAVSFAEATSRSNIVTTDTVKIILGKIKKFFTDLKPHAFSNPTNNLLATVAGTSLDAVQGKVLYDRDVDLSVGRFGIKGQNSFDSIEKFAEATADYINAPIIGRFKDVGGTWGPAKTEKWYRIFLTYQNAYGSSYPLNGDGIIFDDDNNVWAMSLDGNASTGITPKYDKLIKESVFLNKKTAKCTLVGAATAGELVYKRNVVTYIIIGNLLFFEVHIHVSHGTTHPIGEAFVYLNIPELKEKTINGGGTSGISVGYISGGYLQSFRRVSHGNAYDDKSVGGKVALRIFRENANVLSPSMVAARFDDSKENINDANNAIHLNDAAGTDEPILYFSGTAMLS